MYEKYSDRVSLVVAIVALLAATTTQAKRTEANKALEEDAPLVEPLFQFGARLMQQIAGDKKNIVFSPVSVHSALNMLLLGAKTGSKTEKELLKTLGFGEKPDNKLHESYAKLIKRIKSTLKLKPKPGIDTMLGQPPPKLDLWTMVIATRKSARPKGGYLKSVQKYYNSTLKMVDPGQEKEIQKLVDEINDWAENAGFQKDVIDPKTIKESAMLLLSAIRVEAYWFEQFEEHKKTDGLFYNHGLDSELKNGTALVKSDIRGKYVEFKQDIPDDDERHSKLKSKFKNTYEELAGLDFFAAELPLNGDISFACLMPFKKGNGDSLADLEAKLLKVDGGKSRLSAVLDILNSREAGTTFGHIRMPKFHFENDLGLKDSLESMGMKRAFTQQAEFTKMSTVKLFVSSVKHQAMIEATKDGLKAAALTIIQMDKASPFHSPIRVILDNPFMFVLRYNRIPLFMGHLDHI